MGLLSTPRPDPKLIAPLGAYFTDGDQLVRIVESEHAGAMGEDVVTENLYPIMSAELGGDEPHWRRVHPGIRLPFSEALQALFRRLKVPL